MRPSLTPGAGYICIKVSTQLTGPNYPAPVYPCHAVVHSAGLNAIISDIWGGARSFLRLGGALKEQH